MYHARTVARIIASVTICGCVPVGACSCVSDFAAVNHGENEGRIVNSLRARATMEFLVGSDYLIQADFRSADGRPSAPTPRTSPQRLSPARRDTMPARPLRPLH